MTGTPLVSAKSDEFDDCQVEVSARLSEAANELVAGFGGISSKLGEMADEQLRRVRPVDFKFAQKNYVNILEIIDDMLIEMNKEQKKGIISAKWKRMFKKNEQ